MQQATTVLADRYELGPLLGEGGMARVHRGTDRKLRRPVALKVLAPPYDRDESFVRRFRAEARHAASLNHPNIVAVYDSGSDGETQYIVTELVEGETLGELLKREGRLDPRRVVTIAAEVCHALAAAHEAGVIHRDVKPGNVMLTEDGRVKVLDFGIARAAGTDALTRSGAVIGSASYLSPEQARGEPGDERSDIYALGCVVFQMLAGRPPFVADSPVAALYQHVNEPAPPPSSVVPVPEDLDAVVVRALEKDPAQRYGSAAELEHALAAAVIDDDPTATMPLVAVVEDDAAETRPVPIVPRAGQHRASRGFPTWIPIVAGLAILGVLAVLLLDDSDLAGARRELRRSQEAGATTEEPTGPTASTSPAGSLGVTDAFAGLFSAVAAEQAGGQITEGVAGDLRKDVESILEHYEEGDDLEKLAGPIDDVRTTLAEAVSEDDATIEAASRIGAALDDVVVAIQLAPPAAVTEEPAPDEGSEDDHGKDEGSGPPDHANANGNGHEED